MIDCTWLLSLIIRLAAGFQGTQTLKNPPAVQETGFDPWVGKIPWGRDWLPIPVFLPGDFHGQRSLVGYSHWGHKNQTLSD